MLDRDHKGKPFGHYKPSEEIDGPDRCFLASPGLPLPDIRPRAANFVYSATPLIPDWQRPIHGPEIWLLKNCAQIPCGFAFLA